MLRSPRDRASRNIEPGDEANPVTRRTIEVPDLQIPQHFFQLRSNTSLGVRHRHVPASSLVRELTRASHLSTTSWAHSNSTLSRDLPFEPCAIAAKHQSITLLASEQGCPHPILLTAPFAYRQFVVNRNYTRSCGNSAEIVLCSYGLVHFRCLVGLQQRCRRRLRCPAHRTPPRRRYVLRRISFLISAIQDTTPKR